jgi:transposase
MEKIGRRAPGGNPGLCVDRGRGVPGAADAYRARVAHFVFGERPKARVLLEAATESEWVARRVESFGHEVIVVDPGYAR